MTGERYTLGAVKPWVKAAAYELGPLFGIDRIGGYGTRPNKTDHDDGLALDFMTTNGGALARYALANRERLGVTYVIWNQRINKGGGWSGMEDRGSPTANHKDHVHVSFRATKPNGFKGGSGTSGRLPGTAPQLEGSAGAGYGIQLAASDASSGDLSDKARDVAVYGGALALGAVLIWLGGFKLTTPARKGLQDKALTAAAATGPQGAAIAGVAKSAGKGT